MAKGSKKPYRLKIYLKTSKPSLSKRLLAALWKLNSALVAYISVLSKDVMLPTLLNISACCLLPFRSIMVK